MGVHKAIETPEIMWQHFDSYRTETKANPIKKHVFVGKDGNSNHELIERPLTYEGFCNYLNDKDIMVRADDYFSNYEKRYSDFTGVCSRIKRIIRQDQIEKGLAGIYNPSITQRLNGLREQSDVNLTSVSVLNIDPLDDSADKGTT